jgi:predicted extracellular nuclease
MRRAFFALGIITLFAATAQADIRITEWMYSGANGEFVEFTNLGSAAVDMTGWSYSDTDRMPHDVDLSAFGTLSPGQSAILTEANAATFRLVWELTMSVPIIGSNNNSQLGRSDEINLYNADGNLVDTLTYNDQGTGNVKGPRTQNVSGNIPLIALGTNNASAAVASVVNDVYHSRSAGGDVGNPGSYPVPEPASFVLFLIGVAGLIGLRRWR